MEREGRVGQRVDDAVVEHEARAMMAFLARLEHEDHSAGQPVARRTEQLRRADEHRDMRIVPARMHRAADLGREIEPGVLNQRQRIHVATQQHGAAVRGPAQDRDQAGGRGAFAKFERKSGERRLDLRERLRILQAQFGLAMNRAAEVDEVI